MITDRGMKWLRGRKYFSAVANPMWANSVETAGGAAFTSAHNLGVTPAIAHFGMTELDADDTCDYVEGTHTAVNAVSTDLGDASTKGQALCGICGTEVNALGFPGVRMITAADKFTWCIRDMLHEMDESQPLGVKVHWTSGSATIADTVSWTTLLDVVAAGAVFVSPTTALDTPVYGSGTTVADAVEGAGFNQWTTRGLKNKNFLTRAQIDAGACIMLSVTLTAFVTITENIYLLGVEVDYAPRRCGGGLAAGARRLRHASAAAL